MKVEENIKLAKLFDAYGALLSQGQQKILTNYLYDDLTVSEIAENFEVSRQAVMDGIKKSENKLLGYEENLQLVKRIENLASEIEVLKEEIKTLKKKNLL